MAPILYLTFIVSIVTLSLFRSKIANIHEQFMGMQMPVVMTDTIAYIPYSPEQQSMPSWTPSVPSMPSVPLQMPMYQQYEQQQQQLQLIQQQQQQLQQIQQQQQQKRKQQKQKKQNVNPTKPRTQNPIQNKPKPIINDTDNEPPPSATKEFQPPPLPPGTKLVLKWSEEFTGTSLDANKWMVHQGDGSDFGMKGWGNEELQCYNADNL
jgi:TolA-binding protein